jgi:heme exporter protein A
MTLQTSQLALARGHRRLFEALDIVVAPGEALRVLGRNGSGKTSLLRVLCGLAQATSGEVIWRGQAIAQQRDDFHASLVYIGHHSGIKDDLSALENVLFAATLAGQRITHFDARRALALVGLEDRLNQPARLLSAGQRRRVLLARLALAPKGALLVLDEPFNALDQESVQVLTGVLEGQLADGAVVVYTTHQSQTLAARLNHEVRLGELQTVGTV